MRAVAFDAMGVLYTVGDDLAEVLIPLAQEHGTRLTPDEIARFYRHALIGELSAAALWKALGLVGEPSTLETELLSRYQLTPGIHELLDALRSRDVVLGCISNDIGEWSRARRVLHGLDSRIGHWLVSSEIGTRKPDPEIYRRFVTATGLNASEIVFVDDRPKNVEAAAALGFRTMLVDFTSSRVRGTAVRSVDELRAVLLNPPPENDSDPSR